MNEDSDDNITLTRSVLDFKKVNQITKELQEEQELEELQEEQEEQEDNYYVLKNIGYLFHHFDGFCSKSQELFKFWPKEEVSIKKRIEVINKCLDVYDILFPFDYPKPILNDEDLRGIHSVICRMFLDTRYTIMNEVGVDLSLEIGCPGWLDLKKVILRFLSKIKFSRNFEKFEEIFEGSGCSKFRRSSTFEITF